MNKYLGLGIYLYLSSGKIYSANFLSSKFGVCTKTIYRHINQLICYGFPIAVVGGRLGGFKLLNSQKSIDFLSDQEIELIKQSIANNNSITAKLLLAKLSKYQ